MKLDRNTTGNEGRGKYALLDLRKLRSGMEQESFKEYSGLVQDAVNLLAAEGLLQWGLPGEEDEFFVIKLKDRYALPALREYSEAIQDTDQEFSGEVWELACRSGRNSPFCKDPD